MDVLKNFGIAYKGLGEGTHTFDWRLDDRFFAAFESSGIRGGRADVELTLTRSATMLILDFAIRGEVMVECDRCLEDCSVPVDWRGKLTVRFIERVESEQDAQKFDGELMWLPHGAGELNVAHYIYESIVLSLPIKRVHAHDCTPTNVKFVTEEEFARAEKGSEMQKMADNPQWQKLRGIGGAMGNDPEK